MNRLGALVTRTANACSSDPMGALMITGGVGLSDAQHANFPLKMPEPCCGYCGEGDIFCCNCGLDLRWGPFPIRVCSCRRRTINEPGPDGKVQCRLCKAREKAEQVYSEPRGEVISLTSLTPDTLPVEEKYAEAE